MTAGRSERTVRGMTTAAERTWWFIAGHVMFRTGSDAVQARRETPLFLRAVVRSQQRSERRGLNR